MTARIGIEKRKCLRRHRGAPIAVVALTSAVSAGLADSANGGREVRMKAEVKREGNKVWIDGAEPHRWAERVTRTLEICFVVTCARLKTAIEEKGHVH